MNDIVVKEDRPVAAPHTPMSMIAIAVERGADVDQLTKLMELQERYEAGEARKAFVLAMNEFKADPPEIFKKKDVGYGNTHYKHATLDHVAKQISEKMAQHGLSFRWDVEQNGAVSVTCVLMHQLGHMERVTLSAPPDDSGKKNSIQAIGSTVTYLQRYTLLAATGLAAQDDDGQASEGKSVDVISESQLADLEAKIAEYKKGDWYRAKLLEVNAIESLSALPADKYSEAINRLEKFIADS